jgi:predicted AlkP superfamily pyrophosphatase or phosphodiesterase
MKPVISVFFDGLKPESLAAMPFLNALPHQRRLETVLGYSVTCHASMYTGVYPDRHGLWFLWQRAAATSPFAWIRRMALLQRLDCLPVWMLVHRLSARRTALSAYWGIPRLYNLPLRYWPEIDVAEKRYWDEDGYLPGCPTIFERLRQGGVTYEVVGMVRHEIATSRLVAAHRFAAPLDWHYLFIGDVDALSHHATQSDPAVLAQLTEFDAIVAARCAEMERLAGGYELVVWSDHGHVPLRQKIDLYSLFRRGGDRLERYLHIVDTNFARFWPRDEVERCRILLALANVPNGHWLTPAELRREHVAMPDNRYGELIFYLDAGSAFSRTIFGFGLRQKSIHGYLPSHPDCDGVFLSTVPIAADVARVRLVDIQPSLLALLGQPVPPGLDGQVIWS